MTSLTKSTGRGNNGRLTEDTRSAGIGQKLRGVFMSYLIPTIAWTEFLKIAKLGRLAELKACEVTFNGQYLFTAIIPHGDIVADDYVKIKAEYLGNKANILGGKTPEEILSKETVNAAL